MFYGRNKKRNLSAFRMLLARDWYAFADILARTMTQGANVVAIYPDHGAAGQGVAKLRDASFDVTKLSIIGKEYHTEVTSGYHTTGERMQYWGLRGAFRGGMWGCCSEPAVF
jgi:hypothetical protein